MRFAPLLLLPVLLAAHTPVSADCGMEVTRVRNTQELECYYRHGPMSGGWNLAEQEPLVECLEQVNDEFKDGWKQCDMERKPE